MPPCLDVYAISGGRSAVTLDRFLATYYDQTQASWFPTEVGILPLDYEGPENELDVEDYEQAPITSIDDVRSLLLADPPRSFRIHLPSVTPLCGVILAATRAGEIIYGLSVDDPLGQPEAIEQARVTLTELAAAVDATHGWVVGEESPPLDPWAARPWDGDRTVLVLPKNA